MKTYIYATEAGIQIEAITRLATEKAKNASSPKHFSEINEFAKSIMEGLTIGINNSHISVATIIPDGVEESVITEAWKELKDAARRINNFIDDLPLEKHESFVENQQENMDDFEVNVKNAFEEIRKMLPGYGICLMVHKGRDVAIEGNMNRNIAQMILTLSMLKKVEHENKNS